MADNVHGFLLKGKKKELDNLGLSPEELRYMGPLSGDAMRYAWLLRQKYDVTGEVAGMIMGMVKEPEKHYSRLEELFVDGRYRHMVPTQIAAAYFSEEISQEEFAVRLEPVDGSLSLPIEMEPEHTTARLEEAESLYTLLAGYSEQRNIPIVGTWDWKVSRFVYEALWEVDPTRAKTGAYLVSQGMPAQRMVDLVHCLDEEQYHLLFRAVHLIADDARFERLERLAEELLREGEWRVPPPMHRPELLN